MAYSKKQELDHSTLPSYWYKGRAVSLMFSVLFCLKVNVTEIKRQFWNWHERPHLEVDQHLDLKSVTWTGLLLPLGQICCLESLQSSREWYNSERWSQKYPFWRVSAQLHFSFGDYYHFWLGVGSYRVSAGFQCLISTWTVTMWQFPNSQWNTKHLTTVLCDGLDHYSYLPGGLGI